MFQSFVQGLNYHSIWNRQILLWGNKYRAPSADRLLAIYLHKIGFMGKIETKIFRSLIKPGMRVVDIGANQGIFTLLFSQLVGPNGKVFAFEPEPRLFESLSRNCQTNPTAMNVSLFNLALGDHEGSAFLHLSTMNSGDNRLNPSVGNGKGVEVKLARLDQILKDTPVDFIKIDVQGHEKETMAGLEKLLELSPSVKIYFEFWPSGLKAAGSRPEDLLGLFRARGFQLYSAANEPLNPISEDLATFIGQFKDGKTAGCYTNLLALRGPLPEFQ